MEIKIYLKFGFGDETDEHEEQDGDHVGEETGPVVDTESGHEGTDQHEENRSRTQDSSGHQHSLKYLPKIFHHFN